MPKQIGHVEKGDREHEWQKELDWIITKELVKWTLKFSLYCIVIWFVLTYLVMSWGAGEWVPLY